MGRKGSKRDDVNLRVRTRYRVEGRFDPRGSQTHYPVPIFTLTLLPQLLIPFPLSIFLDETKGGRL